uniref:RGS domain-containing protein n=1 Tax=Oncorhynchus tshawytscha TaxID=74940 RepID=A0AAZ3PD98_ONCTS
MRTQSYPCLSVFSYSLPWSLMEEFLKKEFSEENIVFWQACEFFSHVPDNDKKQLSQRARQIYNSYLSSKATTPVNIDSQAQLADDILNAPRPDMFKEQQLQIFNLMKFDSYTRFLKSLLYQECMLAEVEEASTRPLPHTQLSYLQTQYRVR